MRGINEIEDFDGVPGSMERVGHVPVMFSFWVCAHNGFTAPNTLEQIRTDESPAFACAGCAKYPDMFVERRIIRQDH